MQTSPALGIIRMTKAHSQLPKPASTPDVFSESTPRSASGTRTKRQSHHKQDKCIVSGTMAAQSRISHSLNTCITHTLKCSSYGAPACHISINTLSVPFLVNTPTATTSFNQSYDPLVAASNLPLNSVRPSLCVGPSVITEMKAPSWVLMLYRASGRILPSTSVRRQSAPRERTVPVGVQRGNTWWSIWG